MDETKLENRLAILGSWVKVFSLIAIPIVLAIGGWILQSSLKQGDIKHEYVKLAVSILKANPRDTDSKLREWAVSTFNEYSLLKLDADPSKLLVSGEIRFPVTTTFSSKRGQKGDRSILFWSLFRVKMSRSR